MRVLFLLFLISSCSNKKLLTPKDTFFNENERNWEQVYEEELKSALENNDNVAFYFFWPYYLEERYKNKLKP